MKPVHVHPEAEAESDGAFEWYWARSKSAALGFDAALRDAFSTLRRSPGCARPICAARTGLCSTDTLISSSSASLPARFRS